MKKRKWIPFWPVQPDVCFRKQSVLRSSICTDNHKNDFEEGKNVSEALSGKCN